MTNIGPGAKFSSYTEFDEAFEKWKYKNFHPFRVASSETLRMPDGSANETFKYRYIVFHCAHYGAPRMRGAGKRPNQNYLPCGCRAMLRLNFSWSENVLRITTLNTVHTGHQVTAESYSKFSSKTRRLCTTPETGAKTPPTTVPLPKTQNTVTRTPPLAMIKPCSPLGHTTGDSPLSAFSLVSCMGQKENGLNLDIKPNFEHIAATLAHYGIFGPPQTMPLDLTDKRSDEERFTEMHVTLQGLTDCLMTCKGGEFDSKLKQLKNILKSWSFYSK